MEWCQSLIEKPWIICGVIWIIYHSQDNMLACIAKNKQPGRKCYSINSTLSPSTTLAWEGSLLQVSERSKGEAGSVGSVFCILICSLHLLRESGAGAPGTVSGLKSGRIRYIKEIWGSSLCFVHINDNIHRPYCHLLAAKSCSQQGRITFPGNLTFLKLAWAGRPSARLPLNAH